ncbi:MarR family winged helix-turn-helix transcriptional regulator [Nocardioides sp. CFH 31398]|uniref:MarR family winged helix-turn-helix transcriptional regulator n=1 Tax=Nocardioides sp. CFH 31398 TaxID=2919579 RepID=UPI001F068261|nr:MarR family transcriptional regulator [Nocardioides sp. CFH 31398]MCH1867765.1 MarR family transcriptional regulator [Nocardioides sp. CFH 31398]
MSDHPDGPWDGATASSDALDALVCFDLYAASRLVTAAYRPILADLGLTYPQYLVLTVLWTRGECSIKELATTLRLDHATLSPLLRRMEAAGLIKRQRSTTDERSVLVRTTERGAALHTVRDDVYCRINEAIGLPPEQVEQLQGLLRTVTSNLLTDDSDVSLG